MVNQIINLAAPSAQRSDSSPSAANNSNAPDGQAADAFGSVLAKQIEQKSSADSAAAANDAKSTKNARDKASQTSTDAAQLIQDIAVTPDAASIALAMLSNQGVKTSFSGSKTIDAGKSADQLPQTQAATPDVAANAQLVPGNPEIKVTNTTDMNSSIAASTGASASTAAGAGVSTSTAASAGVSASTAAGASANSSTAISAGVNSSTVLSAGVNFGTVASPGAKPATAASVSVNSSAVSSPAVDIKPSAIRASVSPSVKQPATLAVSDRNATTPAITHSVKTAAIMQADIKIGSEPLKVADPVASQLTQLATLQSNQLNTPPVNTIAAPLGSSAWPAEFSQKISWMSTQQNQVAELHLNPPDLGPMSVVISVTDNQATALFSSPHSAVREAIENALPKLRESMADNGIMLGNATVNDQPPRDNGAGNFTNQRNNQRAEIVSTTEAAPLTMPLITTRRHNGLLDTFA